VLRKNLSKIKILKRFLNQTECIEAKEIDYIKQLLKQ